MMEKIKKDRIVGEESAWLKHMCPKCNHLLYEAVQTVCGHRLCKDCATQLVAECPENDYPTCPDTTGGVHLMKPDDDDEDEDPDQPKFFPDKFTQREISKLRVKCQFVPNCNATLTVKELKQHIQNCEHATKKCPDCNEDILKDEFDHHLTICEKRKQLCPFGEILKSKIDLTEPIVDMDFGPDNPLDEYKAYWEETIKGCKVHEGFLQKDLGDHISQHSEEHLGLAVRAIAKLHCELKELKKVGFKLSDTVADASAATPAASAGSIGLQTERQGAAKDRLTVSKANGDVVESDHGPGSKGLRMDDLKREIEKAIQLIEGQKADLARAKSELLNTRDNLLTAQSQIVDLEGKVQLFETKLSTREQQIEEKDFRLSLLETATYTGEMIWKVSSFDARTKDARDAKYTSIFSLPFYTHKYGYKMCLRLYPLGDGMGKNTHLSLFFVVMKSEYDSLLSWPFANKVTLTLINQNGSGDVVDTFKPDPKSSSFQRPKTEMNVASGCPRFVQLDELHRNGFIKDDTIFIKVNVESIPMKYCNSTFNSTHTELHN